MYRGLPFSLHFSLTIYFSVSQVCMCWNVICQTPQVETQMNLRSKSLVTRNEVVLQLFWKTQWIFHFYIELFQPWAFDIGSVAFNLKGGVLKWMVNIFGIMVRLVVFPLHHRKRPEPWFEITTEKLVLKTRSCGHLGQLYSETVKKWWSRKVPNNQRQELRQQPASWREW